MAHKTMVDGTAYDIKGGRTLVSGTAYDIKKGRTLVDGTAYDIGFTKTQIVTVSGSIWELSNPGTERIGYLKILDTQITATGTYTYETEGQLSIEVTVGGASTAAGQCGIWLNDVKVQSGYGTYTLNTDASQITIAFSIGTIRISGTNYTGGKATITTA